MPELHAVYQVLPARLNDPGGAVSQSLCAVPCLLRRYDPSVHSRAALAPNAQCEPAGQLKQAVLPSEG